MRTVTKESAPPGPRGHSVMNFMFVSPPDPMSKPDSQSHGIWRRALWKVIRQWWWSPHDCMKVLIRRNRKVFACFSAVIKWGHSKKVASSQEVGSHRDPPCWHPNPGLPAFRSMRSKCLRRKPPSLRFLLQQPQPTKAHSKYFELYFQCDEKPLGEVDQRTNKWH